MSDLLILISSCILSSVITILIVMFIKHLKHEAYKRKVGVLFNQVKKNRPKHYQVLKNIFVKRNIEAEDIEHKITKLLNLEGLFFTEILKSLINGESYNLNIIYRSYSELITYTELFLTEEFSKKVFNNFSKESFANSSMINKIKLDLSQSNTKSTLSINELNEKFYKKEEVSNIIVLFQNQIKPGYIDSSNLEDNEKLAPDIESNLSININTPSINDIKDNAQEERVLIVKNLTDELEEV